MGWSKTILVVFRTCMVGFKMVHYIMANDMFHASTCSRDVNELGL